MKNIRCFLGFHEYSKWEHVKLLNKSQERLKRKCNNCGKFNFYDGLTEICIETREKRPYIFKN